jgi:uncharacterized protein (TIGR03382 family)
MRLPLFSLFRLSGVPRRLAAATLLTVSSAATAAVIPVTAEGLLIGAHNVDLGAMGMYSVKFAKGSCNAAFNNQCDVPSFAFKTAADALLAANALMDQVLVGRYDDLPRLTNGCLDDLFCTIYTPFGFDYSYSIKLMSVAASTNFAKFSNFPNFIVEGPPDTVGIWLGPSPSYGDWDNMQVPHYAVWTRQNSPVSVAEPGAASLAALGLVLVGLSRRRKRGTQPTA